MVNCALQTQSCWRGVRRLCHLLVLAKKRNQRVSEIFSSLQVCRHPRIPLRKCSVHARDVDLAGPSQLGVLLRLSSITLRPLRSGFHFSNAPIYPDLTINSEMGHCDERAGAKTGLNQAESGARRFSPVAARQHCAEHRSICALLDRESSACLLVRSVLSDIVTYALPWRCAGASFWCLRVGAGPGRVKRHAVGRTRCDARWTIS
jgi:hypothetical protein